MKLFIVIFFSLAFFSGCMATISQLERRAEFDLECPKESLSITKLDGRTMGVAGCDKKATYVENCTPGGWAVNTCTWFLNTDKSGPSKK